MKKFLWALQACLFAGFFYSTTATALAGRDITWPAGLSANISARQFVKMKVREIELLTGRKMGFSERVSLSVLKMKMRKDIRKGRELNLSDYAKPGKKLSTGWIIVIVLGAMLLLALIFLMVGGMDFALSG